MKKYISILRGINVGGKRKILMADLRNSLKAIGFQNVETYIQSGNMIFEAEENQNKTFAQAIQSSIFKSHGFDVPVIVRTLSELKKAQDQNPFLKGKDPGINQLHLTFLSEIPSPENLTKIKAYDYCPDQFEIVENNAFIKIPGKYHKSKLTNVFFEKKLDLQATTRNWKTVLKLIELAEGD